jgi:uracil-DNA glycosylase family 4
MPGDLATFRTWLAQDRTQPEVSWHGPVCLPSATIGATLLVLTDMPGETIDDPALPFDPAQARFMGAMIAAIGLRMDDVAFAPLTFRRPLGGVIDDETAAILARRMRHYLGLARPKAVLILGDRTNRALNTTQAASGPGHLSEINLDGGILKVAALASPEHLMRRPTAKAKSWQTLCLLQGVFAE